MGGVYRGEDLPARVTRPISGVDGGNKLVDLPVRSRVPIYLATLTMEC